MNKFVVMALLIKNPELHYGADNQIPIAEFAIEFPGSRDEDPVSRIKAVAFGNLANEVAEKYKSGDRVIIEGSLSMITVELEGYKEKRAEMTVSRVHQLPASAETPVEAKVPAKTEKAKKPAADSPYATTATKGQALHEERESTKKQPAQDLDEIPF